MALSLKRKIWHGLLYAMAVRRRLPAGRPLRSVGIFKVDRLGDFVLALGAIRAVTEHYGSENCVLIVSGYAEGLARREFPACEIVVLNADFGKLEEGMKYLRTKREHLVFKLGVERLVCLRHHRSPYIDLALAAIPSAHTTGLEHTSLAQFAGEIFLSRLKFDCVVPVPRIAEKGECLELAANRSVASDFIGRELVPADCIPKLHFPSANAGKPYMLLSPFTSMPVKDPPPRLLAETIQLVQASGGISIRIVVAPADINRAAALAATFEKTGARDVTVVTTPTLDDLLTQLAGATVCLVPDTATVHLAAALDRPLLCFLGGGHYGWFGPWQNSDKQRWRTNFVDCFGCNWHCRHPEAYCLTRISPAQVASELLSLLAQNTGYGLAE